MSLFSVFTLISYFIVWALLHSLLASLPVDRLYRLAFNAVAVVTILPMLALLALLPDRALYVVPPPGRWVMLGGQALAVVALGWTLLQTGVLDFLGLAQWSAPKASASGPLQVRGIYCRVRHPLYLFSLVLIWLTPAMTVNLLVVYILTTLYFVIGSMHEERRLLYKFGPAYERYRQQVPWLIPRLRPCYDPQDGELGQRGEDQQAVPG
jgi:protein-S-isoprenylcysteine O-methyltransferase Ste14